MAENFIRPRSVATIASAAVLAVAAITTGKVSLNSADAVTPVLVIPQGASATIDGVMEAGEWAGAAEVSIVVERTWKTRVFLKHDADNLYLAFDGVERRGSRLYPEIMIDPELQGGDRWSAGQLWLHVSNNLCEGNGEHNVYERQGVFQCGHTRLGWEGNNPAQGKAVIEVRVSFQKMGLASPNGRTIGLALDVTDATGDANQLFRYWPRYATISRPASWGRATIE